MFLLPVVRSYDPSSSLPASGRVTPHNSIRERESPKPSIPMLSGASDSRQSPTPTPGKLAMKSKSVNSEGEVHSPFSSPRVNKTDWSAAGFVSDPSVGANSRRDRAESPASIGAMAEAARLAGSRRFSSKSSIELRVAEHATLAEWWASYRPNNTSAKSSRKQKAASSEEAARFKATQFYSEVHGGVKQVLCVDDDAINQQVSKGELWVP